MMRIFSLSLFFLLLEIPSFSQIPFYYKLKTVQGVIYDKDSNAVSVRIQSRRELEIEHCKDSDLEMFLRSLILGKEGRKQLEFLITTSAKITIIISEKVGVMYQDDTYRLIGGLTGPENNQSNALIINQASKNIWNKYLNKDKFMWVYEENTIEIFTGSFFYVYDSTLVLDNNNVKLFDWETNTEIVHFSMDTICIEPLMYPDLMYKNLKELFYFAGLHEIFHTRPENIEIQLNNGNSEIDAIELERKAFKKRKRINRIKV